MLGGVLDLRFRDFGFRALGFKDFGCSVQGLLLGPCAPLSAGAH